MVYAGILAGGENRVVHTDEMPMQYMKLGSKPIIIHTLEQFIINPEIDEIIIAAPKNWRIYTEDLIKHNVHSQKKISVIGGGENKYQSTIKIAEYIEENNSINGDDICIFHDAVRPFVTQRIIKENLVRIKSCNAVSTVISPIDTIVVSIDGNKLDDIPPMYHYFMEQTPQTFRLNSLIDQYRQNDSNDIKHVFNAFKIYLKNEDNVQLVKGESSNIKIVRQYDYELANILLRDKND